MIDKDIQPDELGARSANPPNTKVTGKAFSALKRELSDEELFSTGVQKLLLEELERLKNENNVLEVVREKFHTADKNLAIYVEKQKKNVAIEIVSGSCLAVGAAALGYAPNLWAQESAGWICVAFGLLLTGGGVFAKAKVL